MVERPPFNNIRLPGEPIIISTLAPEWNIEQHLVPGADDMMSVLDEAETPCFVISDMRGISLAFDEVVRAASQSARVNNAILRHPNLYEFLFITDSRLMAMASKGLSSDMFGNIRVRVFPTVEDALAYARARSASDSSEAIA